MATRKRIKTLYQRAVEARGKGRWRESFVLLRGAAADPNDHLARYDLAEWYLEGCRAPDGSVILRRNPARAVRLLESAARAGASDAYLTLANCYSDGQGVRRSRARADYWYRRGVKAGDPRAAFNLAVERRLAGDWRGERRWLTRAAAMGDREALVVLAVRCLMKRGRWMPSARRTLANAVRSDIEEVLHLVRPLGLDCDAVLHLISRDVRE